MARSSPSASRKRRDFQRHRAWTFCIGANASFLPAVSRTATLEDRNIFKPLSLRCTQTVENFSDSKTSRAYRHGKKNLCSVALAGRSGLRRRLLPPRVRQCEATAPHCTDRVRTVQRTRCGLGRQALMLTRGRSTLPGAAGGADRSAALFLRSTRTAAGLESTTTWFDSIYPLLTSAGYPTILALEAGEC
jgi:hypothetical protein